MEKYMKVSGILNEQDSEDCINDTVRELFHQDFEELSGVIGMQFEEILSLMQDITARHRDVAFQKEEAVLNRLMQMENEDALVYISKDGELHQRLGKLHDVINGDGNFMGVVTAIHEFVRLLGKHTTTESAWANSEDGAMAQQQAEETCSAGDAYQQSGMRERDF